MKIIDNTNKSSIEDLKDGDVFRFFESANDHIFMIIRSRTEFLCFNNNEIYNVLAFKKERVIPLDVFITITGEKENVKDNR